MSLPPFFDRPIIFLDIESTGADPERDRIVELALIKLTPGGERHVWTQRFNPGIRIPIEAIRIHGITNEMVANQPSFAECANKVLEFISGCDVAGFGIIRFDVPLLRDEIQRAGLLWSPEEIRVIDGLVIFHQKERRDLTAAYQFFCQKELQGAHGALADAEASLEVVMAQLQKYPDLPQNVDGLHAYCQRQDGRYLDPHKKLAWKDGEAAINFGKHKGETLKTLVKKQKDYIEWMVTQGKFSQQVIDICWKALRGEFPTPPTSSQNSHTS